MTDSLSITVLVPTYLRIDDLTRCLDFLNKQTRPAEEILVIVSSSDTETQKFLQGSGATYKNLRSLLVEGKGQVLQLNAGVAAAKGDIVAITDDDAAPHINWLEKIEHYFLNGGPQLAGVGGRDIVYGGGYEFMKPQPVVGKVQWFGRVIGEHHLGSGGPREVDVLKGVNCAYRLSEIKDIGFDSHLLGSGAQVHNDLALSLYLRRKGLRLLYDPEIIVDHYPAKRLDEDQRNTFNPAASTNAAYNETVVLLTYLPSSRRAIYMIWSLLIGTRQTPGFIQFLRLLPKEGNLSWKRLVSSSQGRIAGWFSWNARKKIDRI